ARMRASARQFAGVAGALRIAKRAGARKQTPLEGVMKGNIGKKVGMTQIFKERGEGIPGQVIEAGPWHVNQGRTAERDGYTAVQLGFSETKPQRLTRGQLGHLNRNNLPALRYLREFRVLSDSLDVEEGATIKADVFAPGERVDVIGTSKGRGFA